MTKESLLISRVSKVDSLYLVETTDEIGAICYDSVKQWDNLFQHSDQKDIKKEKKKSKVRKGELDVNKMILRIKILIQHIRTLKE